MADAPETADKPEHASELAAERSISTPVSVVLRKRRGATRWAPWIWQAIGVLPEQATQTWRVLREDENGLDVQLSASPLELHRSDADSYRYALAAAPPSLWVVAAPMESPREDGAEFVIRLVTASPYEAEAYLEGGDVIVDQVPAPAFLLAWIDAFVAKHPPAEPFKKRRRDGNREEEPTGGLGDPRIRQLTDVYRAPGARGAGAVVDQGGEDE